VENTLQDAFSAQQPSPMEKSSRTALHYIIQVTVYLTLSYLSCLCITQTSLAQYNICYN